jgi:ion channel-forming bestrophin family protein
MIQYDPKSLLSVVFRLHGSVFVRMVPRVVLVAAIGEIAYLAHQRTGLRFPTIVHTLIGVALGLLLVFRTNASYDRYWEGRKLLGSITNRCRDVCRQAVSYLEQEAAHKIRRYTCAFYHVTAGTLRGQRGLSTAAEVCLTEAERRSLVEAVHRAPVVATWMSGVLAREVEGGRLTERRLTLLDQNITALIDALGGAERIRNTPVPFAYAQHIKIFVILFVFTVPFAMVDATRAYTPLAAALLAFALFGIDEIGVEIEDPFGDDPNDLPMDAIGAGIERATSDIVARGTCCVAPDSRGGAAPSP